MFFTIFEMKQRPNLFYCNDKPIVSELYRQHSIFQATFSFDLKRHAFKLLLDAKKLIQLWIRLGYKAESFPYVSTQKMRNTVNPLLLLLSKKEWHNTCQNGCIEPPRAFAYRQVRFVTHTKRFFTALVIVMCQKKS